MTTDPDRQPGDDQTRHPLRDAVMTAAVLVQLPLTHPVPELLHPDMPTEPAPLSQEANDLGGHHQRLMEERMERAFELGNALHPAEQVEERRRDTRSER